MYVCKSNLGTPFSTPTKTPTKISSNVNISPTTKNKQCAICGKLEWNPDYRRKLFKSEVKTNVASKLEAVLSIEIDSALQSNIVCKKCVNAIEKLKLKLDSHQSGLKLEQTKQKVSELRRQFQLSQNELVKKYTTTTTKRLCKEGEESTSIKRKIRGRGPLFIPNDTEKSKFDEDLGEPLTVIQNKPLQQPPVGGFGQSNPENSQLTFKDKDSEQSSLSEVQNEPFPQPSVGFFSQTESRHDKIDRINFVPSLSWSQYRYSGYTPAFNNSRSLQDQKRFATVGTQTNEECYSIASNVSVCRPFFYNYTQ